MVMLGSREAAAVCVTFAMVLPWVVSIWSLPLLLVLALVVYHRANLPKPPPPALFKPYAQPTWLYPIKFAIFYCIIRFRKARPPSDKEVAGHGVSSHSDIAMMEKPQPLNPHPMGIDAVFFSGSDTSSGWGVIMAMERRPNRFASSIVYLKVPDEGILTMPCHPDSAVFRDEEDLFQTSQLSLEPKEPMKLWHLKYDGPLRLFNESEGAEKHVVLDLQFKSVLPHFDYDTQMDPVAAAKAFACEHWSREYFNSLKEHHQTHYEQMGHISGTATIDGKTHNLHMQSFRDHSYGAMRDWRLMHRYVFHHVFLKDGSMGVVGVVCQPSTCSRLVLGNWWTADGRGYAVEAVDLQLMHHGEGGTPPTDYAFTFKAGGFVYVVTVKVEASPQHYLGWNWETRMVETWVSYTVNGIEGSGICEWQYNHPHGRPASYTSKDPEWSIPHRKAWCQVP